MRQPINPDVLCSVLEQMDIPEISDATIRQSGAIARALEKATGVEFLHLEMGIPGLPPASVGVEAECAALKAGIASVYPDMKGTPELKTQASRFLKAYLDIDLSPEGCIPTVGSMQGSFSSFLLCSQLNPSKDTILFIDPGFPVQRSQARILGIRSQSFDIYDYRGEKLAGKLEEFLSTGRIAAIIYSSPNNPAWFNLTEDELRTIGEAATRHDAIVIEDLAYMCMDFRKPLGRPFEPPFQPTVAKYTDNYIILMSASKMFSYAGQRIAMVAVSDKLYMREYEALRQRYRIARLGEALVLGILYAVSSGTSHSAQYALAAMFKAASDGALDFVADTAEYGRRASLTKKMFLDNGFHIVYSKDGSEDVSDGFFYTVGYMEKSADGNPKEMTGALLMQELMLCGICSIALSLTGSAQNGVRICVSQLNRPEQFDMLSERLRMFAANH